MRCTWLALTAGFCLAACRLPEADRIDPTGTTGPSPVSTVDSLASPFVLALHADSFTDDSVTLTWTRLPATSRLCLLERSDLDTLSFRAIAAPSPLATSFVDVGFKQIFVPYFYRLRVTDDGARTSSAMFRLYLDPMRPISVHPVHVSSQSVMLQWVFKGNICQGFAITRASDFQSANLIAVVPAGARSFTDTTIVTESVYTYQITTRTKSQAGLPSLPVKIRYLEDPSTGVSEWRRVN